MIPGSVSPPLLLGTQGIPPAPTGRAYVTNYDDGTVSVIDTATNTVISTITVMATPNLLYLTPDNRYVCVLDPGVGSVKIIDTTLLSVVATVAISLGGVYQSMVALPDSSKLYITTASLNKVDVVSLTTFTLLSSITVGAGPRDVCVTPNGLEAYVANHDATTISVINTATDTVSHTITVTLPDSPKYLVASLNGAKIFCTDGYNNMSVVSTSTHLETNVVPMTTDGFYEIELSANGSDIYAVDGTSLFDFVVGTESFITYAIPGALFGANGTAALPNNSYVYIPDSNTPGLTFAYSKGSGTVTHTISTANASLTALAFPDNSMVYVFPASGVVNVINTATFTVIDTFNVGLSTGGTPAAAIC